MPTVDDDAEPEHVQPERFLRLADRARHAIRGFLFERLFQFPEFRFFLHGQPRVVFRQGAVAPQGDLEVPGAVFVAGRFDGTAQIDEPGAGVPALQVDGEDDSGKLVEQPQQVPVFVHVQITGQLQIVVQDGHPGDLEIIGRLHVVAHKQLRRRQRRHDAVPVGGDEKIEIRRFAPAAALFVLFQGAEHRDEFQRAAHLERVVGRGAFHDVHVRAKGRFGQAGREIENARQSFFGQFFAEKNDAPLPEKHFPRQFRLDILQNVAEVCPGLRHDHVRIPFPARPGG